MKSRKMLAVGLCGMVAIGLVQGVNAAEASSENKVPVTYDYTGAAEPVDPKYGVSIPTGLVFTASNTTSPLDISVKLTKAPGETEIVGPCSAKVSVKSQYGYTVKLTDGKDPVAYTVKYDGKDKPLEGTAAVEIGTLSKGVGDTDKLEIAGSAKLNGVASKTGAHTDILTYAITNVTVIPEVELGPQI